MFVVEVVEYMVVASKWGSEVEENSLVVTV